MKQLSKQDLQELIDLAKASGNEKLLRGVGLVVHEVKVLRYKVTQNKNGCQCANINSQKKEVL